MTSIRPPFKALSLLVLLCLFFKQQILAQTYGLGFASYESMQDKRTSLDLAPNGTICLDGSFELEFDMAFFPRSFMYFGYIFRMIDQDQRNIDLVFNTTLERAKPFDVVIGDKCSDIAFSMTAQDLYYHWNKLRVKFDVEGDRIIFSVGKKLYIQKGARLKKNGCYKIFFGCNNYGAFKSTDAPPMKIRDIKILNKNELKYHWPLGEVSGTIAHEMISQADAVVLNPKWMAAQHQNWQQVKTLKMGGLVNAAFDAKKENLYLMSRDTLYTFSTLSLKLTKNAYREGRLILNKGSQAIFDPFSNSLYNFYPDLQFVSKYNFDTKSWDKKFVKDTITDYWHVNKFISGVDTALYILNGYGHLRYRKDVQRSSLADRSWRMDTTKGDFYTPRYLAALGTNTKADTAYILGGYGSKTGEQILNPKNIYDLVRFTVKDGVFKKMFDLKVPAVDVAFANSLIIDDKTKTYYGLAYPQHRYNSYLRLVTGSLTKPDYRMVGDSIPYSFHDIHSFADLYYASASKKFIAVTIYLNDNGRTEVNIHTLLSPPYEGNNADVTAVRKAGFWPYFTAFGAIVLLAGGILVYRKTKSKMPHSAVASPVTLPAAIATPDIIPQEPKPAVIDKAIPNNTAAELKTEHKNTILLFGDLQVFDAEGSEVTKYFTPLIKELFLIILLYTLRRGRGVSSEKLNEILWYDKTAKSANNNRSVNIAKLKNLLDRLPGCSISKDTGNWTIEIDHEQVYVDYHSYLSIVKVKKELDIEKIKDLSAITQRGNFLSNIEYEWLDRFKSEISNDVIDTYLQFARSAKVVHDGEFLIALANYVFYFDPVNEEAMILKCKAQVALGKHSLAKNTFENFCKEYKAIYGEDFKRGFQAILE